MQGPGTFTTNKQCMHYVQKRRDSWVTRLERSPRPRRSWLDVLTMALRTQLLLLLCFFLADVAADLRRSFAPVGTGVFGRLKQIIADL